MNEIHDDSFVNDSDQMDMDFLYREVPHSSTHINDQVNDNDRDTDPLAPESDATIPGEQLEEQSVMDCEKIVDLKLKLKNMRKKNRDLKNKNKNLEEQNSKLKMFNIKLQEKVHLVGRNKPHQVSKF